MKVSFGKDQYGKPTPAHISRRLDIISAMSAALTVWVQTAGYIPVVWTTVINSILGLAGVVSQVLKPFYGVSQLPSKIDTDEVTAIETKTQ